MSRPIFVDIDGTLTDSRGKGGLPIKERIGRLIEAINDGFSVVVWSGNGTAYAEKFCRDNEIAPLAAIGKPEYCIDDCPEIRPGLVVKRPEAIDGKIRPVRSWKQRRRDRERWAGRGNACRR